MRSASGWPIENGIFGVVKILLLIGLAAALPHLGIYISWLLPVVDRGAADQHADLQAGWCRGTSGWPATARPRPPGRSRRFLAGDFTGALCLLATANLVPIVVATLVGPGANAYFYIAWIVGATVDLLAVNMAMSLTVESSFNAGPLAAQLRTALRRAMLILVPVAARPRALAPWVLTLFGAGYAAQGAPILELLAVATLPKTLTEMYLGALRAQSRTSLIALIQGVRCRSAARPGAGADRADGNGRRGPRGARQPGARGRGGRAGTAAHTRRRPAAAGGRRGGG